jgi:hypothetical protein
MTQHRIYIETVFAEDLLQLPEGVHITAAALNPDRDQLVIEVESAEDLGAADLNALYGNIEEDEKQVHLGILEPR